MCCLKYGNAFLADANVSLNPHELRTMLNIAHSYSNKWKFSFGVEKSTYNIH